MAICHWVGVFEIVGFWQLLLVKPAPKIIDRILLFFCAYLLNP
jgi:hypothetical protein